ncbi:MAG TPA: diguanylate cyclase [Candidatus Saccharimonadales bacterium]|nr:diguanylate cyclase [Candidatus Saccharimonadales bacterium]
MPARASDNRPERILTLLDRAKDEADLAALDRLVDGGDVSAASLAVRRLTHLEYGSEAARELLRSALRHRKELAAALGRDPGMRIALFDLLVGVQKRVSNPKIIDLPLFEGIERCAITDYLTGAANRSYLDSRLDLEIRRARRYGEHLSLLMLDLDDFKSVNDTSGHLVGDRALREVGQLIVATVRDVDIAARFGGEEFAVILPETPRRGAWVVAERIRVEIERHFRRRGGFERAIRLTVSGGLSCYPQDAEDPSSLISKADRALYKAKRAGKNKIELFFEEKRRAERITVEERRLKANLRGEAKSGPFRHTGRVRNISEGGLLIELPEPVPVGSELQVSFSLGHDNAYSFPSTVVRVEEFESEGKRRRYGAGLRFLRRARALQPALTRLARQQLAAG